MTNCHLTKSLDHTHYKLYCARNMKTYSSFADVLKQWPSMAAFGEDVDIDATHAQTMKNRDSIPAGHWLKVVAAAKNRGIRGVNVKALAAIAAEKEAQKKLKEAGT